MTDHSTEEGIPGQGWEEILNFMVYHSHVCNKPFIRAHALYSSWYCDRVLFTLEDKFPRFMEKVREFFPLAIGPRVIMCSACKDMVGVNFLNNLLFRLIVWFHVGEEFGDIRVRYYPEVYWLNSLSSDQILATPVKEGNNEG